MKRFSDNHGNKSVQLTLNQTAVVFKLYPVALLL